MKRLLIATSAMAFVLASAAWAQSESGNGGMQPPLSSGASGMSAHPAAPDAAAPNTGAPNTGAMSAPASPDTMGAGTPTQARRTASPGIVREAQSKLKQQGLYNGAVDGKLGPETRAAVSRFQKKNGLPQTASLDPQTLASLVNNNNDGGSTSTPSATPGNATSQGGATPGNALAPGYKSPSSPTALPPNGTETR